MYIFAFCISLTPVTVLVCVDSDLLALFIISETARELHMNTKSHLCLNIRKKNVYFWMHIHRHNDARTHRQGDTHTHFNRIALRDCIHVTVRKNKLHYRICTMYVHTYVLQMMKQWKRIFLLFGCFWNDERNKKKRKGRS